MNIDWTIVLFEGVNFVVLVVIAWRFLFRPIRKVLDQRQAEIVARGAETEAREAETAAVRADFEARLRKIDELAEQRVDAALANARTEAEGILGEARTRARARLDEAEAELVHTRQRALEQFRGEVLGIAAEAARRVVREVGHADLALVFARRAAHSLDDAIGVGQLAGPIEVYHSPELGHDALTTALTAEFGASVELRLHVDEGLISGVRLDAQGFEVEASAGASLDAWYQSLLRAN
jgi:F-type H+-transporting ATPase subunit b